MTVLYYGIKENNGGLENFAKNLISAVVKQDEDIHYVLLVTCENFSYRKAFEQLGCEIIVLPNPRRKPFRHYLALKKTLKKYKNSVIHLNVCSFRNYFLFHACKRAKLRTIIVGHCSKLEGKLRFLHYINRKLFSNFALNVTISDDVTKFMFSKGSKSFFIDNGIPCEAYSFDNEYRNQIRKKYDIPDDCFLIGQVGRISSEKNQMFSIEVFKQLKKKYNVNTKIMFVGKEMCDEPIKSANSSQYKDDIIFVGTVFDDIEKYYSAFDVCIMPSKHEGMPLTLLECGSNGIESIFSFAIPKLKVSCPQLKYRDLVVDEWVEEINTLIKKQPEPRINYLTKTIYDIDVCAKSYLDLYLNYDSYINRK